MSRFCPHCGTELPAVVDAFCPSCRDRLDEPPLPLSLASYEHPVAAPVRSGSPAGTTPWPWRLRLFLVAFYGAAVLFGFGAAKPDEQAGRDAVLSAVMAVALGWWAVADARARRRPIPLLARPWFVLFAGLLVPGYVVRTRGWRGAVWVVAHAVGWVVVASVVVIVSVGATQQ
ncbi:MAG TPA: zinc ribbon domain-containing protein [Urbifossiella sp.]|jgi:hypothetical protein|nr:zinc ribbon domain-containing protein [Urbifossiella sp.]